MTERKATVAESRYTVVDKLSGSSYFGDLYRGFDEETGRAVQILRLPAHLVSFIGHEQIELRANLFQQDPALPMLKIADVFSGPDGSSVVYDVPLGARPLLHFLDGESLPTMIEVFKRLCDAVSLLHNRTMWHGAIVPEHVWVMPDGNVRLMTMLTDQPLSLYNASGSSESLEFFAPELMTMSPFDARTDIYNLGVLFYYVLTDTYPFSYEEGTLYPPSRFNQHIPPQLDRMVLKMINQRPTKRFQWIGQIIEELTRTLGRHEIAEQQESETYGSEHLFSPEFTGRIEEVAQLSLFYERQVQGGRSSLLITGRQGIGRKRLIYEVSGRYMFNVSGVSVVCSDVAGATIEDLTCRLLMICFGVPKLERVGQQYVRPLSKIISRIAFEYRDMLNADTDEELAVRGAGLAEGDRLEPDALLLEFFTQVIEVTAEPFVLELYDVHRLDYETVQFFKKLLSNEQLMFGIIGVAEDTSLLLGELFQERMHLSNLPVHQLRECVASRFGDTDFLSDQFIEWLNHHSNDTLGQALQLVEYLVDTRQIYLQRYVWHMDVPTIEDLNIPESMESLILYRLEALPDQAKKVCRVLTLFKGAFVVEAAAKAAEIGSAQELTQILYQLAEQGLLLQTHNYYRFPSANVKQHLYEAIPEGERREMHHALGHCLLDVNSLEFMEIAYQLECGREWRRAIAHYIQGARRSFRRNLLLDSETQIRKALELYVHLPGRTCPNAFYNYRAKLLKLSGSLEEASDVYQELYENTGNVRSLINMTISRINIGMFHRVEPYVALMEQLIREGKLQHKVQQSLMVILGMYYIETEGNYSYIRDLEEYQQRNGSVLREEMRVKDYISWLYNLQVLLTYVPGIPWEHRARYLHEAATLAEHHNFRALLVGIYNCMAIGFQETDPLKAKDYYLQSASLAADLSDKSKEAIAYINLIEIYRMLGDMYHSHRYIEKARETGIAVNKGDDTYLLQNEIEHFMFIEDYEKAEQVINKMTVVAKRNGQQKMRDTAWLFRFQIYCEQGNKRRIDRLWPLIQHICEARKFESELQFLRAKYQIVYRQYQEVIDVFLPLVEETGVPNEVRIKRYLLLLEAMLQAGRWHDGLELGTQVQQLIHNTGYVGFLAKAHFYLGRLYQLTHQFVQANLNYKRALMWFRKLNQQGRLAAIDRYMSQTNMEMVRAADGITDRMLGDVQGMDPRAGVRIADGGARLKDWARAIVKERQEMIDTLTDNEILLDAIRRVSSSIMVKTVCENLAAVVFENLLLDQIHLSIKINEERIERIHLNEQLQETPYLEGSEVEKVFQSVIEVERPVEMEGTTSYLYGIPVYSHDQQVIAIMVLEKMSLQTPFTIRDKRFITSLAQLVSSNVENSILYEVMITDNLTGLYQRNYFQKRLNEEFTKIQRYGIDLSFLMIDLDDFSQVNNRFGHNEGDRVLRAVAQTLQRSVRNVDIVGRFGGEEMVVILPNTNGSAARIVAERILNNLRALPIEGNRYQITASIGVASFDLDHPVDVLDLIEKADQAETYAKRNGKNRVVCHWEMVAQQRE
ncbi:diguanylate cyclase [Tumebacillus permanentifrigoris]|uniref:Diguanylate cyclase (GGDEF)-like protein n=1 Tax=Tumebacillus permanentifrigoris TaxID=378543 RepID=A0A316D489_9BACL|nr:diguanylate cyclase [Tumebacillus permanentifrigoris]PWK06629.1 diguanylate cyclase (GGDEF)-like protein [Tumebacillus permanentifrigoris]